MVVLATQPVTVTTFGADAAIRGGLEEALRLQWAYGFPRTPKGFGQLTHGFYRYPAGLQPAAAAQLLELLPPGRVLDPFCGGGTTLVEAERSGRAAVGTDASPLAVFTAQHHTWRASAAELDALRQLAAAATTIASDGGGGGGGASRLKRWQPLHDALTSSAAAGDERLSSALWFCFAAALQRAEKTRAPKPAELFQQTVGAYADAVAALGAAVPPSVPAAEIATADARTLSLSAPVDSVVTSPPYPGVYDYLSTAREERAKLGSFDGAAEALVMGLKGNPSGRDGWPDEWKSNNEMGARKALRRRATEFAGTWQSDHEAWLRAVAAAGAQRAAIVIGDGPGVDALESTRAAAAASGWRLAASATIESSLPLEERRKGSRRTEHAILLDAE